MEEEPADHADKTDRRTPLKRHFIPVIRVIRGLFLLEPLVIKPIIKKSK
jgi:hypothetical protein